MPNHFHLLVELPSSRSPLLQVGPLLSAMSRIYSPGKSLWERGSQPIIVPDSPHLRRTIRYLHLNPCREGLAADPLEWEWSTHRDVIGASASTAWLDLQTLCNLWQCSRESLPKVMHRSISSDLSVKVEGTSLPRALPPHQLVTSLARLEEAIIQASRARNNACRIRTRARQNVIQLAARIGGFNHLQLATHLGITDRTVRATLGQKPTPEDEGALRAATLILSDLNRFVPNREHASNRLNFRNQEK